MAEVKEDNPVGILYHLLRKALGESPDKAIKDVWCAVFYVNSPNELWEHFVELKMLIDRVKKLLSNLQDSDFHLEGFSSIEGLLNVSALNERWGQIRGTITSEIMVPLEGAARQVSRESPNPEEEIAALQSDIESLTNQVLKSDSLDAELRTFIVENLEVLRRGLVAYRIGGIDQLRKAFNEVTGSFLFCSDRFSKDKDTEEIAKLKTIYSKVRRLLQKFYPALSFTADMLQIISFLPLPR